MSIRDLASDEFNHLRIENLDYFLDNYSNNARYKTPFKILAELEEQIKFQNSPESTVLSPYKSDGDCVFDLIGVRIEEEKRFVVYRYSTTVS